jgi:hypothetical protein
MVWDKDERVDVFPTTRRLVETSQLYYDIHVRLSDGLVVVIQVSRTDASGQRRRRLGIGEHRPF